MSLASEARDMRLRIEARMRELEPFHREYEDLRQALLEMGAPVEPSPGVTTRPQVPADPPSAPTASASPRRRQPRASTVELHRRVADAVREQPGETVAVYAERLGIAPAGLYRTVRDLTADGELVKRGRQLWPS